MIARLTIVCIFNWVNLLTAFYSFRLIMYVFHGQENYDDKSYKPHETYTFVIAAMTPLTILAFVSGWSEHSFMQFSTKLLPSLQCFFFIQ